MKMKEGRKLTRQRRRRRRRSKILAPKQTNEILLAHRSLK
jgi:hypothetical protein